MALNTLYECKNVSSEVIMQFLREENERVSNDLKHLRTSTAGKSSTGVPEEKIAELIEKRIAELRYEEKITELESSGKEQDTLINYLKDRGNEVSKKMAAKVTQIAQRNREEKKRQACELGSVDENFALICFSF